MDIKKRIEKMLKKEYNRIYTPKVFTFLSTGYTAEELAEFNKKPCQGYESFNQTLTRLSFSKGFLFLLLTVFAGSIATAQEYTINGTVRSLNDMNTGNKISSGYIALDSSKQVVKINPDGTYTLTQVQKGNHTIEYIGDSTKLQLEDPITVNANTTFNIAIPDKIQTVGTLVTPVTILEKDLKNGYEINSTNRNPRYFANLPIKVFISGANAGEITTAKNVLGSGNGILADAPEGSFEKTMKRVQYQFTNDSADAWNNGGLVWQFNANGNTTGMASQIGNTKLFRRGLIQTKRPTSVITGGHEQSWTEDKKYVQPDDRGSIMNVGAPVNKTPIDWGITWVNDNHIASIRRGEQHGTLYGFKDPIKHNIPTKPQIKSPAEGHNFGNGNVTLEWDNEKNTTAYDIQIGDSTFTNTAHRDTAWTKIKKAITLDTAKQYFARVRRKNNTGYGQWSDTKKIQTGIVTSIFEIATTAPRAWQLSQNYPNPFNPSTTIAYSLVKVENLDKAIVTLSITDILGRVVSIPVHRSQSAGDYTIQFNGASLPSGVYFYTLQADGFRQTKRMLLQK